MKSASQKNFTVSHTHAVSDERPYKAETSVESFCTRKLQIKVNTIKYTCTKRESLNKQF